MKCISSEKGRLPKSIFRDFSWFLSPQGRPKMSKNEKNAFRKPIEKKKAKKEAIPPVAGRVRRRSRGQKECKIPVQEGFCLGFWQLVYTRHHSRRSAADSFRSRDPRRPLRLKVSKIPFHITDQHQNIMLVAAAAFILTSKVWFKNKVLYWLWKFDTKIWRTIDSQRCYIDTQYLTQTCGELLTPNIWRGPHSKGVEDQQIQLRNHNQKNISFTCIRAMSDVCYAGKSAILKKKHYFYLHTRHLRSILGACYAGKSDVFFWELQFYLHKRHLVLLLCR